MNHPLLPPCGHEAILDYDDCNRCIYTKLFPEGKIEALYDNPECLLDLLTLDYED